MSTSRSLEYGWFFIRLCMGLRFLELGVQRFNTRNVEGFAIAALLCGVALLLGLLVRPAVLLLLVFLVAASISRYRIDLLAVRRSLVELLALTGFLIGGGGSFLALGAAISGLKDRWCQ